MKALILVGGYGTRLRPLTFTCPKPLVELANKPILLHQIEALVRVGVVEIILAINYQAERVLSETEELSRRYNVKIVCSLETEPLGTAGPIRLARDHLIRDNPDGIFFVLNSDIICEFPFQQMLEAHRTHRCEGYSIFSENTMFIKEIADPFRYGVVITDESGRITEFVEKPSKFVGNKINCGLYLFNISVIDRIPLKPTSFAEVFPKMAQEGQLYATELEGFWKDVGIPKDYIEGTEQILYSYHQKCPTLLSKGKNIIGNVLIEKSAEIDDNAFIGPNVVIGPNCKVKEGVRLKNCVLMQSCEINANSWISESIIGWNSRIGKWVRIEGVSVCGEAVSISDEVFINQSYILPNRSVTSNIYNKGTILM